LISGARSEAALAPLSTQLEHERVRADKAEERADRAEQQVDALRTEILEMRIAAVTREVVAFLAAAQCLTAMDGLRRRVHDRRTDRGRRGAGDAGRRPAELPPQGRSLP
jgi:hypothetical protein